jgi:hypothetical protein
VARPLAVAVPLLLALAGCAAPSGDPPAGSSGEDPLPVPAPRLEEFQETWTASASAGPKAVSALSDGPGHTDLHVAGNVTGLVVEMEWVPSSPLTSEMRLSVRRGYLLPPETIVAEAQGTSPLRLALAGDDVRGDLVLLGTPPGPVGAAVAQGHTFHVAWFEGIPFDEGYSVFSPQD